MAVIEDALFLLAQIYRNEDIGSDLLAEKITWDHNRVERAIRFLEGDGLLEILTSNIASNGIRIMLRCSSEGIKAIENDNYYKRKYGKEFNIYFITTVNIDTLFKAEFESIFKSTLFS